MLFHLVAVCPAMPGMPMGAPPGYPPPMGVPPFMGMPPPMGMPPGKTATPVCSEEARRPSISMRCRFVPQGPCLQARCLHRGCLQGRCLLDPLLGDRRPSWCRPPERSLDSRRPGCPSHRLVHHPPFHPHHLQPTQRRSPETGRSTPLTTAASTGTTRWVPSVCCYMLAHSAQ